MCNLYRLQHTISDIDQALDQLDLPLSAAAKGTNLPEGYVGADQDGSVLVSGEKGLEIRTMRWGFPEIRDGAKPITNIRNLDSSWWQDLNGQYIHEAAYRCLVPFTAFAEWNRTDARNSWFEVDAPLPVFAGVWRPWTGERLTEVAGRARRQRLDGEWTLYAFLTTEPNDVVGPIHPKAMPVILTTGEDMRRWLAGGEKSFGLQRPLKDALTRHLNQ